MQVALVQFLLVYLSNFFIYLSKDSLLIQLDKFIDTTFWPSFVWF